MSVNGRRGNFELEDLRACARNVSMKRGRAEVILAEVNTAVAEWPRFADHADLPAGTTRRLAGMHRGIH